MQKYLRYCPICVKENHRNAEHSDLYVAGMVDYYKDDNFANTTCMYHQDTQLIQMHITCEEFQIIRQISNDPSFVLSMNDLKDKDIIEYNLKLSQMKSNLASIQVVDKQHANQPHCPTCGSTNISKIGAMERVGSVAIWGLFSKKINKTFKCNNCGHTW